MLNALCYKEWIKTRWYGLLALVVSSGFAGYAMLRIARVLTLKGAEHLWVVMLQRDAIFVDLLQFVPLVLGLALAIVQFAPEMHHKSFKLTLHLPVKSSHAVLTMLLYGVVALAIIFLPAWGLMYGYLQSILAVELWRHILLSAAPWYLAGFAAYLLTAWVALEPTWKHRVIDMVIGLLVLRIYFLAPAPEAYNAFLPWLAVATLLLGLLSMRSLTHFRDGRQD